MLIETLKNQVDLLVEMKLPQIMERFILRNAQPEMTGKPYDDERMEPKMCFMNATHLSMETHLPYVEGMCMRKDFQIPFHHAWCEDGGEIVDPTLVNPELYTYLGVEIPPDDLIKVLKKTGMYGVLDYGMINIDYMFKRDPELKAIVEEIIGRKI